MSIYGGPDIITNGLVLHLDAANSKSYPLSGTVWNDLSGNNNHATLTNGPTYSSSNNGNILFDGVNDYGTIQYNSILNFSGNVPMTICIVKKTNSFKAYPGLITWGDQEGGRGGWQILDYIHNIYSGPFGSIVFSRHRTNATFVTFTGYDYISSQQASSLMHISFTYNPVSGSVVYLNGISVNSSSTVGTSTVSTNHNILLGNRPINSFLNSNIYIWYNYIITHYLPKKSYKIIMLLKDDFSYRNIL